ncbi:type II toxin-antitoxin system VapC family toxin [Dialister sp.]|uniref:type II toxin-antitoxin system VapC family toxin n=1 Tax=Dialister sp. TaxID=1955814 RepID=UPI002E8072C2|nr:PIN domain-containing protein [Dialister sp.]MEE3453406.1 PIN domain-containing protein [Dialister sp.]
MKILIDANILLDVLQEREQFLESSKIIWKLCETEQIEGVISTLTVANLIYVMRKKLNPETIDMLLTQLFLIFSSADLTESDLKRAGCLKWKDFEDSVQSVIAERIGADYIVTRNLKDFTDSKIRALDPESFLLYLENL